jgi:hypothetical protein
VALLCGHGALFLPHLPFPRITEIVNSSSQKMAGIVTIPPLIPPLQSHNLLSLNNFSDIRKTGSFLA